MKLIHGDTSTLLLQWVKSKDIHSPCKAVEQLGTSHTANGNSKWHNHFRNRIGSFVAKLNIHFIHNYITQQFYPSKMHCYVHTKTNTQFPSICGMLFFILINMLIV